MRKKIRFYIFLLILSLLGAGTLLFIDFYNNGWYIGVSNSDKELGTWLYILGAALCLVVALICLLKISKLRSLNKEEEQNNKDQASLKERIDNPKTVFDNLLRDAYLGVIVNSLQPLPVDDCSIYKYKGAFAISIMIKKDEKVVKIDLFEDHFEFKRHNLPYNFDTIADLYKYIKTNA